MVLLLVGWMFRGVSSCCLWGFVWDVCGYVLCSLFMNDGVCLLIIYNVFCWLRFAWGLIWFVVWLVVPLGRFVVCLCGLFAIVECLRV